MSLGETICATLLLNAAITVCNVEDSLDEYVLPEEHMEQYRQYEFKKHKSLNIIKGTYRIDGYELKLRADEILINYEKDF